MSVLGLTYAVQTIGLMTGLTWRILRAPFDPIETYLFHAVNCGFVLFVCVFAKNEHIQAIDNTTRLELFAYVCLFFGLFPLLDDAAVLNVQTALLMTQGIMWGFLVSMFATMVRKSPETTVATP